MASKVSHAIAAAAPAAVPAINVAVPEAVIPVQGTLVTTGHLKNKLTSVVDAAYPRA
jgi:hypothetical protein